MLLGSQNWDYSSWRAGVWDFGGTADLAEYVMTTDNPTNVQDFDNYFQTEWDAGSCAGLLPPGTDWYPNNGCPTLGLLAGEFVTEVTKVISFSSTTIIARIGTTIINASGLPLRQTPTGEIAQVQDPIVRILTSDVSLIGLTFKNGPGYAIEIGDGVTPLHNIVIAGSIFENNALGAIKLNGPVEVLIENNTFIGGATGIAINHSGQNSEQTLIRNNIFYGQTAHTIRVDSADDGGIEYSYNLFNMCVRAVKGICPLSWLTGQTHENSVIAYNMLNLDPLFVDFANHNYHLLPTSPAIDAGSPASPSLRDGDGDGDQIPMNDIGAIGYVPAEEFEFTLVLQTPLPNARVATPEVAFAEVAFAWAWLSETVPIPAVYHLQIQAFTKVN